MMQQTTLTVETHAKTWEYDRRIFGGFLEHFGRQIYGGVFEPGSPLSNERGFRMDAVQALRELNVPIVRWPGGCYVSGYHWEDGIGANRIPTDDMAWGVVEPHSFGTDEFVELGRILDWEPYICNNAGNGTVPEMKHWVEYCNGSVGEYANMRRINGHDEPYNVGIWSIGNENWGTHEIGYKPPDEWSPLVREAAEAMKAADPGIKLSAATLPKKEWTMPLLETAGEYLDYISIHGYWLPLWQEHRSPDYLTCIMQSEGPEVVIAKTISVIEESGHRNHIKIAFDEWNLRGWHHPGFPRKEVQDYEDPEVVALIEARSKNLIPSQYTMADALFSASFFNACLRHADVVTMANIAPLVNTRGPLHVHSKGIIKRTHFHAMAMYASLLGSLVVDSKVEAGSLVHDNQSVPVLDAIVTGDEDKNRLSIALVNRHPLHDLTCRLQLPGSTPEGACTATVLTGDDEESYNSIERPNRVMPVETEVVLKGGAICLPPHSLTIVNVAVRE